MRIVIFLFSLGYVFVSGAEKSHVDKNRSLLANSYAQSSVTQKTAVNNPLKFDKNKPRAKGIILSFYQRPNVQEKKLIITNLEKAGFKKTIKIERFKSWVFEGSESNKIPEIKQLCKRLLSVSSLESCEPDYFVNTAVYNYVSSASDAREMIGKARSALEKAEKRVENGEKRLIPVKKK